MRTSRIVGAVWLALSVAGAAAFADEQGDTLKARIAEAYKNAKTHQSSSRVERISKSFGWTLVQTGEFKVAFDREAGKLRVQTPEMELAIADSKIFAKSEKLPSRHLVTEAPVPLDYIGVARAVPYVTRPVPVPELLFLLADDPFALMGDGSSPEAKVLPPDDSDPLKRERLELTDTSGKTTLTVDPSTRMISEMLIEPNDDPGRPGMSEKYRFTFGVEKHDQSLDGAALAFDPAGSEAVGDLDAWTGRRRAPEPQQAEQNALEGKPAPDIQAKLLDGKDFKLSEVKQKVVVLDFWATWCGPCRAALPHIDKVSQWAVAEKKDAVIYAVNLGEPAEQVKPYWEGEKFTMPTVLDVEQKSGEAYGIQGIPMTVIISQGKVRKVHVGFRQDTEAVLKKEIEELLAEK